MSETRVSEMKSLIKKGHTLEWIGGKYGISRQRVEQILNGNGFSLRAHSTTKKNDGMRASVKRLHAKGLSDREISEKLGILTIHAQYYRTVLALKPNPSLRLCEVCDHEFRCRAAKSTMCFKCSKRYGQSWTHFKYQALRHPELIAAIRRMISRNRVQP